MTAPHPLRRLRRFLLLALALVTLDVGQRWWFRAGAPPLQDRGEWSHAHGDRLLLVEGPTLDADEDAACRRDLTFAARGFEVVRCVGPEQDPSALWGALDQVGPHDRLVVYLSGHGGGRNFGAGGRLNFTGGRLAESMARLLCRRSLVVVDCCWAGEFHRFFMRQTFRSPCLLITSTDASHMAPFPTSFLAPASFGRDFFRRLGEMGATPALTDSNRSRRGWSWLYPDWIGLEGQGCQY